MQDLVDADVGAHSCEGATAPSIDAESRRELFRGSWLGLRVEGFTG